MLEQQPMRVNDADAHHPDADLWAEETVITVDALSRPGEREPVRVPPCRNTF